MPNKYGLTDEQLAAAWQDAVIDFAAESDLSYEHENYDNRQKMRVACHWAETDEQNYGFSFLACVRVYAKALKLKYAPSVIAIRNSRKRWCHECGEKWVRTVTGDCYHCGAEQDDQTEMWGVLVAPPDYYTDDHALNCGCELCVERAMQNGLTIISSEGNEYDGVVTGRYDPALDESDEARFERYLNSEDSYDPPTWAEGYDVL